MRSGARVGSMETPVSDKWRDNMIAAKSKLRASYAGPGPYTVATVLHDVDHWWQIATKFANEAPSLSTMLPARLKEAKNNALNLLEARAQLKLRKPDEIVTPEQGRVYLDAMVAPIDWLIGVGKPVLDGEERTTSTLRKALYITAGIAAIYGLSKLLSSGAELTREVRGFRAAPVGMVHNPPPWAADPEIYETARTAVADAQAEGGEPFENPSAVTVHVYKQLGGRVS
jgi:hypothetical protein